MLTLLITLFCFQLSAPPYERLAIIKAEAINPYEAIWQATCKVESDNNPFAIGDKHLKDYSYGIVQVRKARLKDYYNKTGVKYSEMDMFDPVKSKELFMYYASRYNPSQIREISSEWNGGTNWKKKKSTMKYYKKILRQLNN